MEDLDDFMHQENLPLDLRFRTRSFFEYGFNHSREIPGIYAFRVVWCVRGKELSVVIKSAGGGLEEREGE